MQPFNTMVFTLMALAVTALHIIIIILGSRRLVPRHVTPAPRLQVPAQTTLQLASPSKTFPVDQNLYTKQVQKIDEILQSIEQRLKAPQPVEKKLEGDGEEPSPQVLDLDVSQLKNLLELARDLREEVAKLVGKTPT